MFIDDVNNRYTYLNSLKNIVWEEANDRIHVPDREVTIHPDIEVLLNKLLHKRPTWRFKSTQRAYSGPLKANRFAIYDGDEDLGEVWIEHHWRSEEVRYYFTNFRLAKSRQRTSYTSKPDIALKRIVKSFHMRTPKERAADAASTIRELSGSMLNEATWPLRRARTSIENELFDYARLNWEKIKPLLGTAAQRVDLPELTQTAEEARALSQAVNDGLGVSVRIEPNGSYCVSRPVNDTYEVQSYSEESLPDHIRGALGLLKLMTDKASIDGVGLRVNRNLYFVMDKREDIK